MVGRQRRLLNARSDRGAATLAEVIVAMVLAALLLGVVAVVASGTEHEVSLSGADFAAQRSASQVLSSALTSISDASPLGACQGAGGTVYTTALSDCAHVVQGAPAVAAASSSGPPTGLCWYSYPNSAVGLVAPDLRCLVAYSDGEVWAFDWPPASTQSTYTSCDPASCFGQGAPAPGQLPSEPSGPEDVATLAGKVSQPQGAISFYDQGGGGLSLSASSSASEMAQYARVYKVDVKVTETWGAGPDLSAYGSSETYDAVIGQAVWQGQQQAPLGAPIPPPLVPAATTTTTTTTVPPLSCPANPTTSPVPGEPWAYEADNAGNDYGVPGGVAVANPENKVVSQVVMPGSGGAIVASPNGPYVYAGNDNGEGVDVISTATNAIVGTLDIAARALAVSPDGNYLYAFGYPPEPQWYSGPSYLTVWKVSTATDGIVGMAQFPSGVWINGGGNSVAVSPDGSTVYADGYSSQSGAGLVFAVDTADMAVAATTTLPLADGMPEGVAVGADGSKVFVATTGNDVVVLSAASGAVVGSVAIGTSTYNATVAPDGTVYVDSSPANEIWAIDPATDKVVSTIAADGPYGMEVSPDGKYLYVTETMIEYMDYVTETAIYSTHLGCEVSYVPSGAKMPDSAAFLNPGGVALVSQPATGNGSGYNNTGISSNADPADANFDGQGDSYSAQALAAAGLTPGATVKALGFNFTWPDVPANTPDNWEADGQTIPLSLPAGTLRLGVLLSDSNGGVIERCPNYNNYPSCAIIHYSDGTSSDVSLAAPDWALGGQGANTTPAGYAVVATTPYRNPAGASSPLGTYVFAAQVPVDPAKTVVSITLPYTPVTMDNYGQLHIFAFAGSSAGSAYNASAIATNSDPSLANYDGNGDSYSAEALAAAGLSPGASFSAQGAQMTWPDTAPGQSDYWAVPANTNGYGMYGAILPAPSMPSGAKSLVVVGSSVNGAGYAAATLVYSDGSTETADIGFSAWALDGGTASPSYNNTTVAQMPYRDCTSCSPVEQQGSMYVFATSLPLLPGKTLEAVVLPPVNAVGGSVGVFAMGGSTQVATGAPAIFSLSSSSAYPGEQVTINGTGFGASQGNGFVSFEDWSQDLGWGDPNVEEPPLTIDSWSNTAITFTVPTSGYWGSPSAGNEATVNVHMGPLQSATALSTGEVPLAIVAAPS